jgi:hypothetical protein
MINLKSCSRCGGDLMIEELLGERELVCLQCGRRYDAPDQPKPYSIKRRVPTQRAA